MLGEPKRGTSDNEIAARSYHQQVARKWLCVRSADFDDVCTMAGLSAEVLHRIACRLWRAIFDDDPDEVARIRKLTFTVLTADPTPAEETTPIRF